jgi:hypothetical protein
LENEYLTFEVDESKSVFLYTWKSKSGELSIDEFLIEAQKITEGILNSQCKNVIGNDIDFLVTIPPEIQEQMNEQLLNLFNNKIDKFIHISSKEFVSQLSVEQLFEENSDATYSDHFVDSFEEALALISD